MKNKSSVVLTSIKTNKEIVQLLKNSKKLSVDIKNPQNVFYVDIRENGKTFVYSDNIKGIGAFPQPISNTVS